MSVTTKENISPLLVPNIYNSFKAGSSKAGVWDIRDFWITTGQVLLHRLFYLFYWDYYSPPPPKPVFGITHFISADSVIT